MVQIAGRDDDREKLWMTNGTSFNPHKEEDEGYLAAQTGRRLTDNPYPRGTIRYSEWRRGWHTRGGETRKEMDEGHQAALNGQRLKDNPYPRGTIRYDEWRRGWHIKSEASRRAVRLGMADEQPTQ